MISKDVALLFNIRPCKQMNVLTNYSAKLWLQERPEKLVSFLSGICNVNSEEEFDAYKIASLIEQLYGCRNEKLVSPINLLTYNLSNSKLLVNLNNSITPAGSYTFLNIHDSRDCRVRGRLSI